MNLCWSLRAGLLFVTLFTALPESSTALFASEPPLKRVVNSTLRIPLDPSVLHYRTADAFNGLSFANPVAVASPPGETNRLFIVERAGRISVIADLDRPSRIVFLDISSRVDSNYESGAEGLCSLAFPPGYATNRQFYVLYTLKSRTATGTGSFDRLARFETSATDPNAALPNSEVVLLNQRDEGYSHDWNDLKFGPDGYLYIAAGDEGDSHDQYNNSQRIDKDFFSGILRLDVDKRPGSVAPNAHPASIGGYAVPPDNPFIGATQFAGAPVDPAKIRTELYAVGLRNPWRISFDPMTGVLFCGDVGQQAAEEIDVIVKGGNYGWAYREASQPGFRGDSPPGLSFLPPLVEYGHGYGTNQGNCVIGGVVYRGQKIPQLNGAYVFGDYASGQIWKIRYDGQRATPMERLTSDSGIVGFGIDPRNGDVLLVDHDEGKIKRLEYRSEISGSALPETLAATGVFQNLASLTPEAGVVPYDVNVSFWSDGARKQRWFCIPDATSTIGFNREGNWALPSGTVWVKHFELELTNGVASSARRLETRLLVRNSNGVYGVTYRWGNSMTNASLVPEEGLDEVLRISDGGIVRTQVWHYPSRNECLVCHTPIAGFALGFNTPQLNRDARYSAGSANQIRAFSEAGYFSGAVSNIQTLAALAPADDESQSLEHRVRSYLAANCAQCHQPGGTGVGFFDARFSVPTIEANLIDAPLSNYRRNLDNRVVKPGSPDRSMLLNRIVSFTPGHMPPLASSVLDTNAVSLLSAWITNELPKFESFSNWQSRIFGSANAGEAAENADPDLDGASNWAEYVTGTNPRSSSDVWKVRVEQTGNQVRLLFAQPANRSFEVQVANALVAPTQWQPLDVPDNRRFFPATNRTAIIEDRLDSARGYYRVQLFTP